MSKVKVIIEVDQSDPTQTIIKNDSGDTYTFKSPEQFNDFLYGSKKINVENRCSDCGDLGWKYNQDSSRQICPCHY